MGHPRKPGPKLTALVVTMKKLERLSNHEAKTNLAGLTVHRIR